MTTATLEGGQAEKQLVVFDLVAEAYGVDIGAVREIIRMQDITKVPRSPEFVEGIINLRGNWRPSRESWNYQRDRVRGIRAGPNPVPPPSG